MAGIIVAFDWRSGLLGEGAANCQLPTPWLRLVEKPGEWAGGAGVVGGFRQA
jgi:hypothetical protein